MAVRRDCPYIRDIIKDLRLQPLSPERHAMEDGDHVPGPAGALLDLARQEEAAHRHAEGVTLEVPVAGGGVVIREGLPVVEAL